MGCGQQLLSLEDAKLRQCRIGELCWLETVSRPGICARLARIASRIDALQGSDVCRIKDLVKAAKEWQQAAALKYASSSHLGQENLARRDANMRRRQGKIHGDTMTLVGWSDAAYGGQSKDGKRRLGFTCGLLPALLVVSCHLVHWSSRPTRLLSKVIWVGNLRI